MLEIDYSKFKGHALGPWQFNPEFVGIYPDPRTGPFDMIAAVCNSVGKADANAHLIAAAPALLERNLVLESVVENIKCGLTPQTVALAKAIKRDRVADREIDALSEQARDLRVQNDILRHEIEGLKEQLEHVEKRNAPS